MVYGFISVINSQIFSKEKILNLKVSQRYVALDTHTQTVCHDNIIDANSNTNSFYGQIPNLKDKVYSSVTLL